MDSGFQLPVQDFLSEELGFQIRMVCGFRNPWAALLIPKPWIPDSTNKNFSNSRIRIHLHSRAIKFSVKQNSSFYYYLIITFVFKKKLAPYSRRQELNVDTGPMFKLLLVIFQQSCIIMNYSNRLWWQQFSPSVPIPPPGRAFVMLSVPAVGNLSEDLCPGVRHLVKSFLFQYFT